MAVDEDDEEQEMDTMKDQGSSKVKDASYLSEETRSWEKPMTSSLYQFNTQADSQEQVIHNETRCQRCFFRHLNFC